MGVWFFLKYTTKKIFVGTGSDLKEVSLDAFRWLTRPSSLVVITAALLVVLFLMNKWQATLVFIPLLIFVYYLKEYLGGEWKGAERKFEEDILRKMR